MLAACLSLVIAFFVSAGCSRPPKFKIHPCVGFTIKRQQHYFIKQLKIRASTNAKYICRVPVILCTAMQVQFVSLFSVWPEISRLCFILVTAKFYIYNQFFRSLLLNYMQTFINCNCKILLFSDNMRNVFYLISNCKLSRQIISSSFPSHEEYAFHISAFVMCVLGSKFKTSSKIFENRSVFIISKHLATKNGSWLIA